MTPELAAALTWVSLYLWLAIAGPFFAVAVIVHVLTRGLLKRALELGNGKIKVARRRLFTSRWYLLGSGLALALGLLSAYSALYLPPPPPDTRAVGAVVRFGVVTMLFAFLMTMIENLRTFRDFAGDDAQKDRIEATSADTNERVREMQERGISDRPAEQTDRREGHEHRRDP